MSATKTVLARYRQFVNGRWQTAAGKVVENRNPARFEEVLGLLPRGTAADVDAAVSAARQAFPGWRRTSRIRRGELFVKLIDLIRADVDSLAAVLAQESGKILNE